MRIAVAVKVVPDDQDVVVSPDGTLDLSKAKPAISAYDLSAIEAAVQLADANPESSVTIVSAGHGYVDDSKLKKNLLARGAEDLLLILDESLDGAASYETAQVLAGAIEGRGGFDLVICGDGSADEFAQSVDVALACALDAPIVSAVDSLEVNGGVLRCRRLLEEEVQEVEVPLPAVVSVVPSIALPRIPGMRDILAAGKKPVETQSLGGAIEPTAAVIGWRQPSTATRKQSVEDASEEDAVQRFVDALKASL